MTRCIQTLRGWLGQGALAVGVLGTLLGFATTQAHAQTSVVFWAESSNTNRLNLVVQKVGARYYLTDTASCTTNTTRRHYYFVDWDLMGTPNTPRTITNLEVEAGQMHLVHLSEVSQGYTIDDFHNKDAGRERTVAWVWVGGVPVPQTNISPQLSEVKESGSWFYFEKGRRLPSFSQRFPTFSLPRLETGGQVLPMPGRYSNRSSATGLSTVRCGWPRTTMPPRPTVTPTTHIR